METHHHTITKITSASIFKIYMNTHFSDKIMLDLHGCLDRLNINVLNKMIFDKNIYIVTGSFKVKAEMELMFLGLNNINQLQIISVPEYLMYFEDIKMTVDDRNRPWTDDKIW